MRSYMLDTNMASYAASKRSAAAALALEEANRHSRVLLSAVSEGEIRFGLALRAEAVRAHAVMERFLLQLQIVPRDSIPARVYGPIRAELTRRGQTISALDLMIASHAKALGATLVTHDSALLRLTPYLDVVDWATDL